MVVGFEWSTTNAFSQQLQDKKNIVVFQAALVDSLKNYQTVLVEDTKLRCKAKIDSTSHNRTSVYIGEKVFVVHYLNGFYQVVRLQYGSIGFVPESALPETEKLSAIKSTFLSLKEPISVHRVEH